MTRTHTVALAVLALLGIACTLVSWLTPSSTQSDIELTNEVILATNQAIEAAIMATGTTQAAQTGTPRPTRTSSAIRAGTPLPTRSDYPFVLQNNEIIYTQYFFSPECNWLGIAGLVLDNDGNPIVGLPVVLNGGGLENLVAYSGDAPEYGASGWEFFVDNKVREDDFSIRLHSSTSQPLSDEIQVHTRADCQANLIMVVCEQNWDDYVP